jgi:hypothetical protein
MSRHAWTAGNMALLMRSQSGSHQPPGLLRDRASRACACCERQASTGGGARELPASTSLPPPPPQRWRAGAPPATLLSSLLGMVPYSGSRHHGHARPLSGAVVPLRRWRSGYAGGVPWFDPRRGGPEPLVISPVIVRRSGKWERWRGEKLRGWDWARKPKWPSAPGI